MTLQEALDHGITALMRQHRDTVVSQDLSDYAKALSAEVYIHAIFRLSKHSRGAMIYEAAELRRLCAQRDALLKALRDLVEAVEDPEASSLMQLNAAYDAIKATEENL